MNMQLLKAASAVTGLLLGSVATRGQEQPAPASAGKATGCCDTLYVSTQMTTYLIFPRPVSVWDLGSKSYAAKIESGNMLYVKPLKANTPLSTLLVQTTDGTIYLQYVAYRQFPRQLLRDYRTALPDSASGNPAAETEEVPPATRAYYARQTDLLRKQKSGKVFSRSPGRIRFQVTNVAVDSGAVYLLLNVHNRSSIPYRVQYVSFAYREARPKKSRRRIHPEHREVHPLHSEAVSIIRPQQLEQMAYVLPSFASTRKGHLEIIIREENGNRILRGLVPATRIAKSLYLPHYSSKPTSHVRDSK